jgi:hypothetical protein
MDHLPEATYVSNVSSISVLGFNPFFNGSFAGSRTFYYLFDYQRAQCIQQHQKSGGNNTSKNLLAT